MESPKDRAFLVRQAMGSVRKPLPMGDFARELTHAAQRLGLGVKYYASTISDIEAGNRSITLDDVRVFAAVDPFKRGEPWLAFGVPKTEPVAAAPPAAMPNLRPMPRPEPRAEAARPAAKKTRGSGR